MKKFLITIKTLLLHKQKQEMAILLLFMVISSMLEICGISSILPVLSALLDREFMYENSYAAALCKILGISSYEIFVIVCILVLFLVFLIKNAFVIFENSYHAKFSLDFQYSIRKRAFHAYLEKEYQYYLYTNSSDVAKTLLEDITRTYQSFDGFLTILTAAVMNMFLIAAVFIIDWRMSLGILAIVLLLFLVIAGSVRPVIKSSGVAAAQAIRKRNRWIKQAIEGIKTVKVTQTKDFFEQKESEEDLIFSEAEKKHIVLSGLPKIIIEMVCVTFLIIFIAFLVLSGETLDSLIPKIGAIGLAALKLLPGINSITSQTISIQYRLPSVQRISDLLQEVPPVVEQGDFPSVYKDGIRVDKLSFRYNEESRPILNEASLIIPSGKMIGIIGVSGEGKTTFLDLLLGLLTAQSGNIYADDVNIHQNILAWRKSIGYITQDTFLLDDSIAANVAFGICTNNIDENLIWDSLEKAQIADFVRTLPNGIYTEIGERGVRLSGGQCQRIGIARALYNNPQILIFDEATSSLDSETEKAVVESINNLYGKHTIIVVAHRSVALEHCDLIYRIEDGKFIKQMQDM